MRLAGLALVIATVVGAVNDALVYKGIAAALFLARLCGRAATRRNPNLLVVWNLGHLQGLMNLGSGSIVTPFRGIEQRQPDMSSLRRIVQPAMATRASFSTGSAA
jgi:hypothetical protein